MPRQLLTDWEKRFNKNLRAIKKATRDFEKMGLKIEISKDVETMFGTLTNHIYVVDRIGDRVCLQKHLFSVR